MSWQRVGDTHPRQLAAARDEVHWLSQCAALYALRALDAKPDWSHYSLRWEADRGVMQTVDGVVAIRPADAMILVGDSALDPRGLTLVEVLAWVGRETGFEDLAMADLPHQMPAHPLESGATFLLGNAEALLELGRWYANAASALSRFGDLQVWTHHFDIATVAYRGAGEEQIGCGMTPGEGADGKPYFYITPWPYPSVESLPALQLGAWHTEGWTGAVLTADDLSRTDMAQSEHVDRFLSAAVDAARQLLSAA
ncbi:MAG: hypothetical protein ACI80V_000727 [Rhodothermales bacterium]|jgi:hypothetical protein